MLEASAAQTCDAQTADDAVLISRSALERMQDELKFRQTKIEALNFEIARLKVSVRRTHLPPSKTAW